MSAYILDDDVIDLIIMTAIGQHSANGHYEGDLTNAPEFQATSRGPAPWEIAGQMLVNQNYASVNHRYRENTPPHVYKFKCHNLLEPVQILKACDCYDCQACETPGYWDTPAAKFIEKVRRRAIRRLAGYKEAEWGAPANPSRRKVA
jgi:hypothetical protein